MGHRDLGRVEIRGECWCGPQKSEETVHVFIVAMDHRDLGTMGIRGGNKRGLNMYLLWVWITETWAGW